MAKKYDDIGGVWRTIGGRRVFIKTGQSLSSAMKESGKFKNTKKKDNTFKMNNEEKKKYEEVGQKVDDLTKEIDRKNAYEKYVNDTLNNDEYLKANRPNEYWQKQFRENKVKTFTDEIKEQNKIETISKAEYDKMPNDYKGTLKELVDTAEFRGENKQDLIKQYEKMGYDVNKDKTILANEKGGTVLKPVKISDELKETTPKNNWQEQNAKQLDNELRKKEEKYLSSYKGESKLEKERKEIKELHDTLKKQAEKEGYNTQETNWRDKLSSNKKYGESKENDSNKILNKNELSKMSWEQVVQANTKYYSDKSIYDFEGGKTGKYKYEDGWRDNGGAGVIKQSDLDRLITKKEWQDAQNQTNNYMNDRLRRKAYQKYLREHPASKITFEGFKDMRNINK